MRNFCEDCSDDKVVLIAYEINCPHNLTLCEPCITKREAEPPKEASVEPEARITTGQCSCGIVHTPPYKFALAPTEPVEGEPVAWEVQSRGPGGNWVRQSVTFNPEYAKRHDGWATNDPTFGNQEYRCLPLSYTHPAEPKGAREALMELQDPTPDDADMLLTLFRKKSFEDQADEVLHMAYLLHSCGFVLTSERTESARAAALASQPPTTEY